MDAVRRKYAAGRILGARPETVIAIVSAYSDFGFALEAMKLNIREYLSKPIRFEIIRGVLLNHRKEPTVIVNNQLAELLEIVKGRDFKRAYYELKPVPLLFATGRTQSRPDERHFEAGRAQSH